MWHENDVCLSSANQSECQQAVEELMEQLYLLSASPCVNVKSKKTKRPNLGAVACKNNPKCLHAMRSQFRNAGIWKNKSNKRRKDGILQNASRIRPRESDMPCGLTNLGATCWANALFQSLYMNQPFRDGIMLFEKRSDDFEIINELQLLFGKLKHSVLVDVNPSDIIAKLVNEHNEQQDIQEFSRLLINKLQKNLKESSIPQVQNLITDLFQGELVYHTECNHCHCDSEMSMELLDLCLEVKGIKSIEESIDRFFSEEFLKDENSYYCNKCKERKTARRHAKVRKLPPVLHLLLNRFDYDVKQQKRLKIKSKINIPLTLPLNQFAFESADEQANLEEYELESVLSHLGNCANSGHYIAEISIGHGKNIWFRFDDSQVSQIDVSMQHFDDDTLIGCSAANDESLDKSLTSLKNPDPIIASNDAYMLVYVKKRFKAEYNHSDRPISSPQWVLDVVNLENEKIYQKMHHDKALLKMKSDLIDFRVNAVEEFWNVFDHFSVEEHVDCLYIASRMFLLDWLKGSDIETLCKYLSEETEIKQPVSFKNLESCSVSKKTTYHIFPNDLKCIHGLLSPDNAKDVKYLSAKQCGIIESSRTPLIQGSFPELKDAVCLSCCAHRLADLNIVRHMKELGLILKQESSFSQSEGLWVNQKWITSIQKVLIGAKGGYSLDLDCSFLVQNESDMGFDHYKDVSLLLGIDSALLGEMFYKVRCMHGRLSCMSADLTLISTETANRLLNLLINDKDIPDKLTENIFNNFGSSLLDCDICKQELLKDEERLKDALEIRNRVSKEFSQLLRKRSFPYPDGRHPYSPGTYFCLPWNWFDSWKRYVLGEVVSPPDLISFSELACNHGKLNVYPFLDTKFLDDIRYLTPGKFILISKSEFLNLSQRYGCAGPIQSIELRITAIKNDRSWNSLLVESIPNYCEMCIIENYSLDLAKRLNYSCGKVTIHFTADKSLSNRGPRRASKRKSSQKLPITLQVSSKESLFILRMKILEQTGIYPGNQVFKFEERKLTSNDDAKTMAELKIPNHAELFLDVDESVPVDEEALYLYWESIQESNSGPPQAQPSFKAALFQ